MAEWYEEFFDRRYVDFYEVLASGKTAESDADFIVRALDLRPPMSVLDLGCGQGRHCIPLAERGYKVTGLDLSETMIERARRFAGEKGVEVTWLQRRMEELDDLGPFDACICLYTVLGYYGDEGDLDVLKRVFAALRPGGSLMLDLANYAGYLKQLPSTVWRETEHSVNFERNLYEPATGWLVTERKQFPKSGGQVTLPVTRVRAYMPNEAIALLKTAGFEPEMLFGSYADEPYRWETSDHQIHVARKPDQV